MFVSSVGHEVVVLFAFFAFCGWVLEVVWRSIERRRFVNPGFLFVLIRSG